MLKLTWVKYEEPLKSLKQLNDFNDLNDMDNTMRKYYAVIGDPIKHSKSPQMHNAAFRDLGMNAEYSAIHVSEKELSKFAENARKNLSGFNVTVPHKENIIQYLDGISDECKITRSVNTVSSKDGKLFGQSTDGYGLEMALQEAFDVDLSGNSFMFLGCGGTVNAVAYHFLNSGAKELFIVNRTISKAEELVDSLRKIFPQKTIECAQSKDKSRINQMLDSVKVVIQATSLGLNENDPSPLSPEMMRPAICMFDTIYKKSGFLKAAKKYGCRCAEGEGMLVTQGIKSFEIWTGIKPSAEVMRETLQ